MTGQSNRRDFLKGKSASHVFSELVRPPLPETAADRRPSSESAGEFYLLHVSRRAMACQFQVVFNAGQYSDVQATEAALAVLDLVERLEQRLSFFRADSELSRVNAAAALGPVEVSPDLFELLQAAMRIHADTGGAYDITSAPYWEAWGFSRRAPAVPTPQQLADARQLVGSHQVELDAARRTVRFDRPGVRLNLGSIGKGYALDCCAKELLAAGFGDFLIHGGQSSVLAQGAQLSTAVGAESGGLPSWLVGLPHPLRADRRLGQFRLVDRALGTSGSQMQSFFHRGKRLGHIIDPRTGQPAEGMLSTTVLAPSAMLADALSTAFYVMEPAESLEFTRQRPGLATVLILNIRRKGGFEIQTAGLDERLLTLFPPE